MEHRNGGKFKSSHTTYTDLAAQVADIANRLPEVTGISPGMIQSGKGSAGGMRKVKIVQMTGGLLLTVRQSRSVQELRLFAPDGQAAMVAIARKLRDNDINIHFT